MKKTFNLVEEIEMDTAITSWNLVRERINKTIRVFNDWQRNGFDEWQAEVVLAEIDLLKRTLGYDAQEWQLKIISEMSDHVKACRVSIESEGYDDTRSN